MSYCMSFFRASSLSSSVELKKPSCSVAETFETSPHEPLQVEDFLCGQGLESLPHLRFWAGALKLIRIIERPIEAWL